MSELTLKNLASARSSDFKKAGWRGVYKRLVQAQGGALTITNHQHPEAVILTISEYERLLRLAAGQEQQAQDALESLRRDFDRRLDGLKEGDLGSRVRNAMGEPVELGGKVRVGDSC